MGRIGVVISFTRATDEGENISDVKADVGGGEVLQPGHFSAPGTDSVPIEGDYVAMTDAPGGVGQVAVGYADPVNEQKSGDGDQRIYGRDADGAQVNEVWLKSDGTIVITNAGGTITMNAGGDVKIECDGQFNVNDNFTVDP